MRNERSADDIRPSFGRYREAGGLTVAERLRLFLGASGPGCSITLTREAVAEWLAEDDTDRAPAEAQERDELTVAEWAELEHRATGTVCSWLAAGLVPGAYKLNGREWRVPREGIVAFKAEQARQHPAPERSRTRERTPGTDISSWRKIREARRGSSEPVRKEA